MSHFSSFSPFEAASVLIVLAATLGYINYRVFKLPQLVALTVMMAVASMIVVGIDLLLPGGRIGAEIVHFTVAINFHETLMSGMLSFLLFAGALHVDWSHMKKGRWPITVLSIVGVLLSTALIGGGFFLLAKMIGLNVPIVWCLVFGALISPTDPVAVMGVLQRASVSPTLEATVAGESLFNDGVGVVVFSIILATALGTETFSIASAAKLFIVEAGGGVLLGLILGWIGYRAMRSVDDYTLEVLISLAMVMGGYTLASRIHLSGPVAMAVAGLLIGNEGVCTAMSEMTRRYLLGFWSLIDGILNAVLFVLIGLEVVAVPWDFRLVLLGIMAIPLVLAARYISGSAPLAVMRPFLSLGPLALPTLIWGGLRGGISVALALGLPDGPARSIALAATYVVVLFSVIIQGGTIARVLEWLASRDGHRLQ
jgi:CPA1 family monovalent cation:H+ antiporter